MIGSIMYTLGSNHRKNDTRTINILTKRSMLTPILAHRGSADEQFERTVGSATAPADNTTYEPKHRFSEAATARTVAVQK